MNRDEIRRVEREKTNARTGQAIRGCFVLIFSVIVLAIVFAFLMSIM